MGNIPSSYLYCKVAKNVVRMNIFPFCAYAEQDFFSAKSNESPCSLRVKNQWKEIGTYIV